MSINDSNMENIEQEINELDIVGSSFINTPAEFKDQGVKIISQQQQDGAYQSTGQRLMKQK